MTAAPLPAAPAGGNIDERVVPAGTPSSSPLDGYRSLLRARRRRAILVVAALATVLAVAVVIATGCGAVRIPPLQTLAILVGKAGIALPVAYESQHLIVVWMLRLPRVALAVLIGGGLALCGASMQGMFRNPLADPALTGVSSGAALGAVTSIIFAGKMGSRIPAAWGLPLAAFIGGLAATALSHQLGKIGGKTSVTHLLLAGIAVNAFCGAGIGLATFASTDAQLRSITFWTLGSLGGANWQTCGIMAALSLVCGVTLCRQSRMLNALLLGEAEAAHLGFRVESCKRVLLVCTALLAGASASLVGIVGFIGLVGPHLARLTLGPDHRLLLPVSAMLGATLLVFADTLCRTLAAPAEIPVGVVTALLGAPFFVWLLWRDRQIA